MHLLVVRIQVNDVITTTMPECTYTDRKPLLASDKQSSEIQSPPQRTHERSKRLFINRIAVMILGVLLLTLMRVSLAIGVFDKRSDTHHNHSQTSIEKRVTKILKSTPLIGVYENCTPRTTANSGQMGIMIWLS